MPAWLALADALAVHAQPETSIVIDWPDSLPSIKASSAAAGSLGHIDADEDETPPWLVFGGMIRTVSMTGTEPGLNPLVTALEEEGFTDVISSHVVESFARHFMVAIDSRQESGFGAVAKSYLERLPREQGVRRDIDENGDLLVRHTGKTERCTPQVLPRLGQPAWFDPATKGPRT